MITDDLATRMAGKTTLQALQIELQKDYNLSPVEALVLARRVQQLADEQTGTARQPGQITYQAIAVDEPPGKPLRQCRKVAVQLTVLADDDLGQWAQEGAEALRRERVHRLCYEALLQGGVLSQEDLACIVGISHKTVKRIFAFFRQHDQSLPSRGEIRDIGPGVSHKIPVIRRYVQDVSLLRISRQLGYHGIDSMARYLHHFALVMVLEQRGLTPAQMQSVIGISVNVIEQYRALYAELNVPANERTLHRLQQTVWAASDARAHEPAAGKASELGPEKGGPA